MSEIFVQLQRIVLACLAKNDKETIITANRRGLMADKYGEMARQMHADGVDEATIARFVAEEMREDEFRRGRGTTEIEAARAWKGMPEGIRQLLLGSAFCPNCGTASFASGYSLRTRDGFMLIEGRCAACGAEIARLCD